MDAYVSREETVSHMYMFKKHFQFLDGKPRCHIIQVRSLLWQIYTNFNTALTQDYLR